MCIFHFFLWFSIFFNRFLFFDISKPLILFTGLFPVNKFFLDFLDLDKFQLYLCATSYVVPNHPITTNERGHGLIGPFSFLFSHYQFLQWCLDNISPNKKIFKKNGSSNDESIKKCLKNTKIELRLVARTEKGLLLLLLFNALPFFYFVRRDVIFSWLILTLCDKWGVFEVAHCDNENYKIYKLFLLKFVEVQDLSDPGGW